MDPNAQNTQCNGNQDAQQAPAQAQKQPGWFQQNWKTCAVVGAGVAVCGGIAAYVILSDRSSSRQIEAAGQVAAAAIDKLF